MATWSRQMWQNVVNRAVRMLTSGSFGSHFFAAVATESSLLAADNILKEVRIIAGGNRVTGI
ncbi:hypothetical protein KIN20_030633 [Parelaphostrongylus tenuis]|uniref:Uncharacterized protein n=1 Tax=Parelaphostrongylus tenuis TaxID=148309 RepID=A0AAD5R3Z7_PARTN|nr:hypothetical protein KIN20_030633 [Parelaphostrongylus tenuis]